MEWLMPPPPPRRPPKCSSTVMITTESIGTHVDDDDVASSESDSTSYGQAQKSATNIDGENSCEAKIHNTSDEEEMMSRSGEPPKKETREEEEEKKEQEQEKGKGKEENHLNSCPKTGLSNSVYSIPKWGATPAFPFSLEIIKDGTLVGSHDVSGKGAYMFGRSDQCDFVLEHPSISRFHAVVQFKRPSDVFIYDLGSTHGTIVNKKQVPGKTYISLHVGDVLKFGLSSRLYVLQGPNELMPKEKPTKVQRELLQQSETAFEVAEREASLQRARRDALQAEGASWGMMEDAFENETQEEEEITWQTYKGQLTEKQQKTLEKIHKRNEKISSLKKEIDAIQVKEIPQGGLTQGQQTQVARNQQRTEQLMEELENLEETLNQSIQESVGARAKKGSFRKGDEEDNNLSDDDDDDFYDRTNIGKAKSSSMKSPLVQVVETAETLLEKREKILKDIEKFSELLHFEEMNPLKVSQDKESLDPLDAFMTDVSSKLESDRVSGLKKEIEKHQGDLYRINCLLKIADPTGEQERNWQKSPQSQIQVTDMIHKRASERSKEKKLRTNNEIDNASKKESGEKKETCTPMLTEIDVKKEKEQVVKNGPLWLGQARNDVDEASSTTVDIEDGKKFMEYKDRHKMKLGLQEQENLEDSIIPLDVSGLILRKKKNIVPKEDTCDGEDNEGEDDKSLWEGAAAAAADKVALLLRHQRGLGAAVEQEFQEENGWLKEEQSASAPTKKRKLGPERPDFLDKATTKFQAWVPPSGQTGDGKTALNKKYGY